MENTVRLSDEELIEIAWEAVKINLDPKDLIGTSVLIEHRGKSPLKELYEPDEPEQVWIWLNHPAGSPLIDSIASAQAGLYISNAVASKGDARYVPLFHTFSGERFKSRQAA